MWQIDTILLIKIWACAKFMQILFIDCCDKQKKIGVNNQLLVTDKTVIQTPYSIDIFGCDIRLFCNLKENSICSRFKYIDMTNKAVTNVLDILTFNDCHQGCKKHYKKVKTEYSNLNEICTSL